MCDKMIHFCDSDGDLGAMKTILTKVMVIVLVIVVIIILMMLLVKLMVAAVWNCLSLMVRVCDLYLQSFGKMNVFLSELHRTLLTGSFNCGSLPRRSG